MPLVVIFLLLFVLPKGTCCQMEWNDNETLSHTLWNWAKRAKHNKNKEQMEKWNVLNDFPIWKLQK